MIKFSSENKNALTPGFVSTALEGITHRFLLVLECETRMYSEGQPGAKTHAVVPPRFAIGGPRATIDPRVAKVEELMPLAKYKLQLPDGWEKVHQYIYVLQPSTDEHGWQYRSEWSNGPLSDKDEQWVRSNAPGLDVRRRLWMATVVSRDLVVPAKRRLAEAISSRVRGVIMEGALFRQEQGALMKTWQKRHVVLTDDTIEIFTAPKDEGGRRVAECSIIDCEAKMLFGVQCPGRDFAFSIRKNPKNSLVALFDAETREVRRRWVVAIRYQLALLSPEVNFPPFDYGPPTGDEAATRVLMCGELQKQGHMVRNWKHRFFQLMPYEIQYFERETLKGNFMIAGAVLTTDEKSLDFSLRSPSGKILVMRADNPNNKATWVRALARQIAILDEKKEGEGAGAEEEGGSSTASPTQSAAASAAAEEEAAQAEKAEEAAAEKEWETGNAPQASDEGDVVVVTSALENTDITKDEVMPQNGPAEAGEDNSVTPTSHGNSSVEVAPVTAAVTVAAAEPSEHHETHREEKPAPVVAEKEVETPPAQPAVTMNNVEENAYYPHADGNRMHQESSLSEFEQEQRVAEAAAIAAGDTHVHVEQPLPPHTHTEETNAEVHHIQVEVQDEPVEPIHHELSDVREEDNYDEEEAEEEGSGNQRDGEDDYREDSPRSPGQLDSTLEASIIRNDDKTKAARSRLRPSMAANSSPKASRPSSSGAAELTSPGQASQRLQKLQEQHGKRQSMVSAEILKWQSKLDEKGEAVKVPAPIKKF